MRAAHLPLRLSMTRPLLIIGWILVAINLVVAATFLFGRKSGDAATSAIGPGIGTLLLAVSAVAAAVLFWSGRAEGRTIGIVVACAIVAIPVVFAVALSASPGAVLGLIFPSMRDRTPRGEGAQYAFPDPVTRETALAILMQDYAKADTLLRGTPAPNLTAHDERGVSLMGIATINAVMEGATMRDVEGLRSLIAAGARPRADDLGREEVLIEVLARSRGEQTPIVLEMLLDAGLSPNTPLPDGRSVLLYEHLTPQAAAIFRARGAKE